MKKIFSLFALTICTIVTLTACNNTIDETIFQENVQIENEQGSSNQVENEYSDDTNAQTATKPILYSNLTSEAVCNDLRNIFDNAGIAKVRQDNFFDHVTQFNSSVSTDQLAGEYAELLSTVSTYDSYAMQDEWNAKNPEFMGYNCRITALGLFADFIEIPQGLPYNDEMIVFDLSALSVDSSAFNEAELEGFKQLYSTVDSEKSLNPKVHADVLANEWKNKGIKFKDSDKVKLISVVLHEAWDDESYLFVGHTGLLFPVAEDELCFVEKLAFQEPYQLTRFSSRKELIDYLMEKYNLNEGLDMAPTFIMENDKLIEGYLKESQD